MRQIEWTTRFKRDFKRESRGQHKASFAIDLETVLQLLIYRRPDAGTVQLVRLGSLSELSL